MQVTNLHRLQSAFKELEVRLAHWLRHHFLLALGLVSFILLVNELYVFGADLTRWDPLLISGGLIFVVGLRLSLDVGPKAMETMTRLADRGVLDLKDEAVDQFKRNFAVQADRWAYRGGLFIGATMMIAFLVAFGPQKVLYEQLLLTIIETLAGYIAGRYLGRMAFYGRLRQILKTNAVALQVQPDHPDTVAGFKPLGDLYFFQAMVLTIPALYLAIWWFLIPVVGRYAYWRDPYLGLLVIVLTIEVLAFLLPVWSFHRVMVEQKKKLWPEADQLSQRVVAAQAALAYTETDQDRKALKEQLEHLRKRYWAIEKMPTWPVDIQIRRRFTLNNLFLFLPIINQALNLPEVWQDIIGVMQDIVR